MSARNAESEVMSLEVLAESVGTVAGVQSWRQRVPNCTSTSYYACEQNGEQIGIGGPWGMSRSVKAQEEMSVSDIHC